MNNKSDKKESTQLQNALQQNGGVLEQTIYKVVEKAMKQGETGATGETGARGEKGDTGDIGPQGEKGDKGDTGEQGLKGAGFHEYDQSAAQFYQAGMLVQYKGLTYVVTQTPKDNRTPDMSQYYIILDVIENLIAELSDTKLGLTQLILVMEDMDIDFAALQKQVQYALDDARRANQRLDNMG